MAVKKGLGRGLGRGLDGLIPNYVDKNKESGEEKKATQKKPKKDNVSRETSKNKGELQSEKTLKKPVESTFSGENADSESKIRNAQSGIAGSAVAPEPSEALVDAENGVVSLRISEVEPNKEQPRKKFNEEALAELAESVKQYGIIQPLLVAKRDHYYEIIAGERRWRAAKIAGLKEVPVIIKDFTPQEIVEVSLIENIQRQDLNPVEEALAYKRLLDEFKLTQDEIATRVSKSRTAVTNSMRLLKLDKRVQDLLIDETLSAGHARALIVIENGDLQFETAQKIIEEKLSVRDTEKLVKRLLKGTPEKEKQEETKDTSLDLIYQDMEDRMKFILGTKVTVNRKNDHKGKIEIEYYSNEELERIYDLLRSVNKNA